MAHLGATRFPMARFRPNSISGTTTPWSEAKENDRFQTEPPQSSQRHASTKLRARKSTSIALLMNTLQTIEVNLNGNTNSTLSGDGLVGRALGFCRDEKERRFSSSLQKLPQDDWTHHRNGMKLCQTRGPHSFWAVLCARGGWLVLRL